MVKIKAFDISHFMNQTVRVCHTYHTDSIISSIACIFDFKKNFNEPETHQKLQSLCGP